MDKRTNCKGQCTACALDCHLRRKPYNSQWDEQGLDRLLEDIADGGYTERRNKPPRDR